MPPRGASPFASSHPTSDAEEHAKSAAQTDMRGSGIRSHRRRRHIETSIAELMHIPSVSGRDPSQRGMPVRYWNIVGSPSPTDDGDDVVILQPGHHLGRYEL